MSPLVPSALIGDDGLRVDELQPMGAGRSHDVHSGLHHPSGDAVIVKLENEPGRLAVEHRALIWAETHAIAVPTVVFFGLARVDDGAPRACLVTRRVAGDPPASPGAWRRMGQALGRLAAVPGAGSGLPEVTADAFGQGHRRKLEALERPLRAAPDGAALLVRLDQPEPRLGPLVFTHGDPGPGNYLDTGRGPVLLDWEEAHIGPQGLDIARAVIIALLEHPHSGSPEEPAKARAVLAGYAQTARWYPSDPQLRWWLTVGGTTFIYNRWRRAGHARVLSWQHAATVLLKLLTDPTMLPGPPV